MKAQEYIDAIPVGDPLRYALIELMNGVVGNQPKEHPIAGIFGSCNGTYGLGVSIWSEERMDEMRRVLNAICCDAPRGSIFYIVDEPRSRTQPHYANTDCWNRVVRFIAWAPDHAPERKED